MGKFAVPGAIVVAGLLIAGAVFFSGSAGPGAPGGSGGDPSVALPVLDTDFILGSPAAKITLIEYSDIDCPFCKQFHETMKRIIDEYGPTGDVAWVYRHFPITSAQATTHSVAAECVGRLGGNTAFWSYLDLLFEAAPGNTRTDPANYGPFAEQVGVSASSLEACMADTSIRQHVDDSRQTAIDAGGTGTPFNILLIPGEEPVSFSSAVPYEQLKAVIDDVLAEL